MTEFKEILDCETNENFRIELTAEELETQKIRRSQIVDAMDNFEKELQDQKTQKLKAIEKLVSLGLSESETKALFGEVK